MPEPPQRGQARSMEKKPWLARTRPWPLQVVQATGTDGVMAAGNVNYEELDQPAVMRRNRNQTVEAMRNSGVEMLDIPAFLRKQAD